MFKFEISLFWVIWLSISLVAGAQSCSGGSGGGDDDSEEIVSEDNGQQDGGEDEEGGEDQGTSDTENSNSCNLSFAKGNPVTLESGAIFPGIVYDGSKIVVSYAKQNDLYIRPYDNNFNALSTATKLTSSKDVTDHKHIFFQSKHYVVYSTFGDNDLYLMKLDTGFTQEASTITVTADSTNTVTNDMLLGTDGTYIITGQFRPSDKNNNETSGHLIRLYDTNLNYVSPDIVANDFNHVNTASIDLVGDKIYIVAPSGPIFGGQLRTQRDLLLIRYDKSWEPVDSSSITLVDSSNLTHDVDGDGIWMSTGFAYHSECSRLLIGHTFVYGNQQGSDAGQIYLRVFDGTTFSEKYSEIMVDSTSANRSHFLLLNDTLYVVYDENLTILGLKYTISRSET